MQAGKSDKSEAESAGGATGSHHRIGWFGAEFTYSLAPTLVKHTLVKIPL